MDRRVILSRIARGEKQAALAKEFHVSRAAICNLNKHRDEVLSRKDTENPLAKHPKKRRLTAKAQSSSSSAAAAAASQPVQRYPGHQQTNVDYSEPGDSNPRMIASQPKSYTSGPEMQAPRLQPTVVPPLTTSANTANKPRLHKLQSRSMALLLTMARARNASITDFRRYSDRLMRLVIEHALALAPMKSRVQLTTSSGAVRNGCFSAHPPCGIAVHPSGVPMLDVFCGMEPSQPAGLVYMNSTDKSTSSAIRELSLSGQLLPLSLNNHNVFVFDVAIQDPQSLELLAETLGLLLNERGACEKRLWVVALSMSSQSIARLQSQFPELQVVTVSVTACSSSAGSGKPAAVEDGNFAQASSVACQPSAIAQKPRASTHSERVNDTKSSRVRSAAAAPVEPRRHQHCSSYTSPRNTN
ncbi:unnamed protein product [Globisporangium polare]